VKDLLKGVKDLLKFDRMLGRQWERPGSKEDRSWENSVSYNAGLRGEKKTRVGSIAFWKIG